MAINDEGQKRDGWIRLKIVRRFLVCMLNIETSGGLGQGRLTLNSGEEGKEKIIFPFER